MTPCLKSLIAGVAGLAFTVSSLAQSQSFDFKDPKGVNNAVFKLDAPLEAINGTASGVSGRIVFDPANPEATRGKIVVDAKSLTVPNPVMRDHLHGRQWMDVATHPEISFEALKLDRIERDGNNVRAQVNGRMTLRGVTREVTVPVRFTYLKDMLGARSNGQMQGDLLVVRVEFTIQRADYGINPGAPTDKVASEIQITLSVAGAAPRS